jgi:HD-like signal output (HDOD) protein
MPTTPSPGAATAHPAALEAALPDLAAWTAWFAGAEIPVMADTAEAIEAWRLNQDEVDANLLGETIAPDPLMTLKLMAHAAKHRSARQVTDPETVTGVIVLMGITPFFTAFGLQQTVEDHLAGQPQALDGLQQVLRRGRRAAQFALAFAVHRLDTDTPVVHQAALLHDFAELLLWVHAPRLALALSDAQRADPGLRSSAAQRQLLNIELGDLQQALMKEWRLPELLVRISDDKHADHPSVRTVRLAIRVARHSSQGWDNPALPDDVRDIAELLQLSPDASWALLHDIDG